MGKIHYERRIAARERMIMNDAINPANEYMNAATHGYHGKHFHDFERGYAAGVSAERERIRAEVEKFRDEAKAEWERQQKLGNGNLMQLEAGHFESFQRILTLLDSGEDDKS
jgi:hypothetical protein